MYLLVFEQNTKSEIINACIVRDAGQAFNTTFKKRAY